MKVITKSKILDFPQDGKKWWVRWVHLVTNRLGATGTPGIRVHLSPIDESTIREIRNGRSAHPFRDHQKNTEIKSIEVHSGLLPVLGLGNIFVNGEYVGTLPLRNNEFTIDTELSGQIFYKGNELWDKKPPDLNLSGYQLVNSFEYKIGWAWTSAHYLVFRLPLFDIVIPTLEIVRTFYAWHGFLALAFTSAPWEQCLGLMCNLDNGTGREGADKWYVRVRRGFTLDDGVKLSPLIHDPFARREANNIYARMQNRERNEPAPLVAKVPFSVKNFTFNGLGLWLQENKFFVFQIPTYYWPYAPKPELLIDLDNSGLRGKEIHYSPRPTPFTSRGGSLREEVNITSTEDPQKDLATLCIPSSGTTVLNAHYERIDDSKPVSFEYQKATTTESPREGVVTGAAGYSFYSETGVFSAVYIPENDVPVDRFAALLEALQELERNGLIDGFRVIPPPFETSIPSKKGYWRFPKVVDPKTGELHHAPWSLIPCGLQKRVRQALIVQVFFAEDSVYLCEIEPRGSNGCRTLVFTPISTANFAIEEVLNFAVQEHGILKPSSLENKSWDFVDRILGWKHCFQNKSERYNVAHLLKKITRTRKCSKIK